MEIHHVGRVSSTQDVARQRWAEGSVQLGDAMLAEAQSSGRGRFGRTWLSPAGGLYATYIMPVDPLLSLRAGVAVARALRDLGVPASLKWPNDVLIRNKKVAGILIEAMDAAAFVGIGLNLTESPLETATHLAAEGAATGRQPLTERIGINLFQNAAPSDVLAAYRTFCATLGQNVRILRTGNPPWEGTAEAIDGHGRLLVRTAEGLVTLASGECHHLRPGRSIDPSGVSG